MQLSAKEACRGMARPKVRDFTMAKQLVSFLKGLGEVKWLFRMQSQEEALKTKVFVDSEGAGCRETRKSTSGGVLMIGNHPLMTWSTTQATRPTSPGETELIAMAEGTSRAMGLHTMLEEMLPRVELERIVVCTDSSVAKSWAATRGLGRMRHLEVKLLRLQESAHRGKILLVKVEPATNAAGAIAKFLSACELRGLLELYRSRSSRAS